MIENSAQENIHGDQTKLNPEQAIVEIGLASSFASVLQQCSTPIYMVRHVSRLYFLVYATRVSE